jgi:hypothetical protein
MTLPECLKTDDAEAQSNDPNVLLVCIARQSSVTYVASRFRWDRIIWLGGFVAGAGANSTIGMSPLAEYHLRCILTQQKRSTYKR